MNTSNTENFIKKAQAIHGNLYSYENVFYEHAHSPVKISCAKHGVFEQNPKVHLLKAGCPQCKKERLQSQALSTLSVRQKDFFEKAKEIHGESYDYSKVEYINREKKVLITCRKHGDFLQTPGNHVNNKRGCPECGLEKAIKAGKANPACSKEMFIKKAVQIHGDKYDYSEVIYKNNKTHITIICQNHGKFIQRPDHHLSGKDCERCMRENQESKKLPALDTFLSSYEVEKEKMFSECKLINMLRFDRFISELNLCIEYDGEQHFRSSTLFGGNESLALIKKRDKIKTEFCTKNKMNLLRIKYNQDPVEEMKKILVVLSHDKCYHLIYGKMTEITE